MNERHAVFYGLAAVLLWSTVATAFKLALDYLTPVQLLTLATGFSALALAVIAARQGKLPQLRTTFTRAPSYYLFTALLNPLAYYLVLFQAYALLPASQAQPLNYSWAVTLPLLSALFLNQKISKRDGITSVLGYLGVVVIATRGDLLLLEFSSPTGVMLALLSALLWAVYWLLNTRNSADPVIGMLLNFVLAWPLCLGLSLVEGQWSSVPWQGWSSAAYIGLFEMGITFVLWLKALKLTRRTARISNLIFISPFISLLLIAAILGESIHPATLAGLMLIVTGLLLQRGQSEAGSDEQPQLQQQ